MADYLDNYDDIVFLDSEIEPDDDSAPFGELITVVDGKVYRAQDIPAPAPVEEPVPATPAVEEAPVAAETPAEEETPAPVLPDYAPVAAEEEPAPALPDYAPVEEPVPATPAVEEEKEELPEADPVLLYAYGVTPAAKEEPAPPVEEAAAPAEPAAEEAPVEAETPVAETPAEEPVAETPAPKKAPAKKKPVSHVIYQSGAEEKDLWGSVSIAPAKKKKEAPAEEASEKQEDAPAKAPAKKKSTKKAVEAAAKEEKKETISSESVADATSDSDKPKEENKVAKEKAAPASAKKTAAKPAEKKAPEKKPAAKAATAKAAPAKKAAPAAKPATKAVKEETKPAEQVIEAGDDSAPHGRFVIKKTDKGNFVYKLYSSNYRVVAIGAGLYTSIANCKTGINSVRNNAASAPIEDQTLQKWEELKFPKWQIYTDKQGEIRLRLLASNGNIVATTNDGYLSKEAAKKGIAAIARAAKGASIVRNDDLW